MRIFSNLFEFEGENFVIFINGGGIGVMVIDVVEEVGLYFYDNFEDFKVFVNYMLLFGFYKNLVDFIGMVGVESYEGVIRDVFVNLNMYSIVVFYC